MCRGVGGRGRGRQTSQSALQAHWLPASPRATRCLGADGVSAARPGACGSRVTASRYALGAEGVGATRPSAHMCSPGCARCLLGVVGMSMTSCAARCLRGSVQGVLRAPAEGEGGDGGTPRGPQCRRLRHTRAERRYGGSRLMARGRRASGVAAAPRSRAAGAPAARRRAAGAPRRAVGNACARAARVQTAGENLVVVVVALAPKYLLRQASPNRGKYLCTDI